jgi:hypothetical protein
MLKEKLLRVPLHNWHGNLQGTQYIPLKVADTSKSVYRLSNEPHSRIGMTTQHKGRLERGVQKMKEHVRVIAGGA